MNYLNIVWIYLISLLGGKIIRQTLVFNKIRHQNINNFHINGFDL